MHVQINSDNNISMHNKLSDAIGAYINALLERFDPYLTRVEVHLTGENLEKAGSKETGPKNNMELPIPIAAIKTANLEYDPRADLQRAKREKQSKA